MRPDDLQRWCDPRTILVVTGIHDDPLPLLYAVTEARRSGARLLLATVIPPTSTPGEKCTGRMLIFPSASGMPDTLDEMAHRLQWQGVQCEPIVLRGSALEEIGSLVRSRDVDRVFVSASEDDSAEEHSRPDLTEQLTNTLEIPVCIVGRRARSETSDHRIPGRILLAHSLHSGGRMVVDLACELARMRQARLTLLHVMEPGNMSEQQKLQAHTLVRAKLSALVAGRIDMPRWPEIVVREGEAAAQIIEEELCLWRDLIILGPSSATAGPTHRRLDVLHRVIAESRCPVLALGPCAAAREVGSLELQELKTGSLNR